MKYKKNILTKIEAAETTIDYVIRNLHSSTFTATQVVSLLNDHIRKLKSIKDLVEADS